MMLVTLQEARDHLRSDDTADNADLTIKIEAASEAVYSYLGKPTWPVDSSGHDVIPVRVKQAVLSTVGWLYSEREGQMTSKVQTTGYGYTLPQGATALLFDMRELVLT